MRLFLKILFAPVILILTVFVWLCMGLLYCSAFLFGLAASIGCPAGVGCAGYIFGTKRDYPAGHCLSGQSDGIANGGGMAVGEIAGFQVLDSGWDIWIKNSGVGKQSSGTVSGEHNLPSILF